MLVTSVWPVYLTCTVATTVVSLMSGNVLHLMAPRKGGCLCVAGFPGKPKTVMV